MLPFLSQKTRLLKLYGKNNLSNNKLRALDLFSKGKDFGAISRELRVQRATAEVYSIDAFAAGKEIDTERLAELLGVTKVLHSQLQQLLLTKDSFNQVKEAIPGCSYNQIRFVLACLIRDVEM